MKEQVFTFIKNNRDCSLVDIYDKFKDDFSTHIILDLISKLEKEERIILVKPFGYRVLNQN